MFTRIKNFIRDEVGAVTVDWVVLTAAIIAMGLIVLTSIEGGTVAAADSIAQDVTDSTS